MSSSNLKAKNLIPLALAELCGTATILFFGCLGCGATSGGLATAAFAFGGSVYLAIEICGSVSGGHFNPAVTLGVLVLGKIGIIQFIVYLVAQFIGGLLGFLLLYVLAPHNDSGYSGKTTYCILRLSSGATAAQGFGLEVLITAGLVMAVCSLLDPRNSLPGKSVSLRIGFLILCFVFALGPYTGAALNPARSLPPALMYNYFDDQWVFQVGPFVGGALGGALYRFLFDSSETYSAYNKLSDFNSVHAASPSA